MTVIVLPWPSAALSGHAQGHWRSKSVPTAKHREWARVATLAEAPEVAAEGDIHIHVCFVPPNLRGDRTNFSNRLKPYYDGIADALKVNDRRFLPSYSYAEPQKPGKVVVTL